jgi:hypothetical protein
LYSYICEVGEAVFLKITIGKQIDSAELLLGINFFLLQNIDNYFQQCCGAASFLCGSGSGSGSG